MPAPFERSEYAARLVYQTFLFHSRLLAPEGTFYVALGDPILVAAGG